MISPSFMFPAYFFIISCTQKCIEAKSTAQSVDCPDGKLIEECTDCAVHLASMHFCVQEIMNKYARNINEGDIIVMNDPYNGGSHIPDVTFPMPVFLKGELLGFAASRGHWADLGGGAPGGKMTDAEHIVQEGLRLPPVKIYENRKVIKEIKEIITNNSRVPKQIEGDIEAHRAALLTAEKGLIELVEKYGSKTVFDCMHATIKYTEVKTREAIKSIQDGVYETEEYIDSNGIDLDTLKIKIILEIKNDEINIDFTGTDKQTRGSVNSTYAVTHSAVYYGLKYFLAPEATPNAGMYKPININIPEGSLLYAKWPAATYAANAVTSERVVDAI